MARFDSLVPDLNDRMQSAASAGVLAACYVVYNEIKRRLRGGYTSGKFVTGNAMNSVTIASPRIEGGEVAGRVGTNVLYMLYWELGHENLFSRRFERVEIWVPAFLDTLDEQRAAFAAAWSREFGVGTAPPMPELGNAIDLGLPGGGL